MNDWKEPPYLKATTGEPPNLTEVKIESEEAAPADTDAESSGQETNEGETSDRESEARRQPPVSYQVLLPPNYEAETDKRYHVVYVLPGSAALKFGAMASIVNDIFTNAGEPGYERVEPCIVVFTDIGGPGLVEKIVPSVDGKFRTVARRDGRSVMGNAFMAGTGFSAGMETSELFSAIGCQSPLMFDAAKEKLVAQLKELDKPLRVYLEWGNFDMHNPDENWDMRKDAREIYELLQTNENITLDGGEVHDSTDWSSWRNRFGKVLQHITGG